MTTINLYFADSDFKLLQCELIRAQYAAGGRHCLISFSEELLRLSSADEWDARQLLTWRFKKDLRKFIDTRRNLLENQNRLAALCTGAEEIILHLNLIYSERLNYFIRDLSRRFPGARLRVRMLFDGILNMRRRPMSGVRRLPQYVNRLKWYWEPRLNYYMYEGDRLGADADVVDRIYGPAGFPHEYSPDKFHPLRFTPAAALTKPRQALVLGSPISRIAGCTRADEQLVADLIEREVERGGFDQVLYKPHLQELEYGLALARPGYEIMSTTRCVERLLTEHTYEAIFGNVSTALATVKLCSSQTRVVSCGLDIMEQHMAKTRSIHSYRSMCQQLGIEVVDAEPLAASTPASNSAA